MSANFIDPGVLVRLVRLYGCLDFSQIARFSGPPGCESKSARRARLKFTAAALRRAVDNGDICQACLAAWRPEHRWGVIWDSLVDGKTPKDALTERDLDARLACSVKSNWREAATFPLIEVFFADFSNFQSIDGGPLLLSARLMIPEFYLGLLDAGANVEWLTRHDPQLLAASAGKLDADEFPYLQYREHHQTSVAVAPVFKANGNHFGNDLKLFRHACHDLGYRCLVLSPRPRGNNDCPFTNT